MNLFEKYKEKKEQKEEINKQYNLVRSKLYDMIFLLDKNQRGYEQFDYKEYKEKIREVDNELIDLEELMSIVEKRNKNV